MYHFFKFIAFAIPVLAFSCKNVSSGDNTSTDSLEHVIVYHQQGRFAGWPANNYAWKFDGDELLVGFIEAEYTLQNGHNISEPYYNWLARSKDGGETWAVADPQDFVGDFGDEPALKDLEHPINFEHPGFAMRVVGNAYHGAADPRGHFFYSYDKGLTWNGPFGFGDLAGIPEISRYGLNELTPRTDYIVTEENECLVFMSARETGRFGSDRLFCLKTEDGGMTFQFQGWLVKPFREEEKGETIKVALTDDPGKNPYATECRAVMSQSVLLENGEIVTVIRRKFESEDKNYNWIDAYGSSDGGQSWRLLSRVAGTGSGNGNPPSMAVTKDGRLCVVYGERDNGNIQVVYSADGGMTWSGPDILMEGFWSEDMELNDLGYARVLCRSDGKMVAVYYYSTREHLHHLGATIWEP